MPGSPRWHVPSGGMRLGVCFQAGTGKVVALQGCNSGKCSRGCGPLGGWTRVRSRAPFAPLCRRGSAEWRELYRLRLLVSILLLQLAQCQGSAIWQVLLVDRHLRRGSLRVGVFGLRLIRFCRGMEVRNGLSQEPPRRRKMYRAGWASSTGSSERCTRGYCTPCMMYRGLDGRMGGKAGRVRRQCFARECD